MAKSKPKTIKTAAGLKYINDYGFRRSDKYITNGHFVVPFKFQTEVEDEYIEKVIPKPEERPIKLKHTGIYLKANGIWLVIFANNDGLAMTFKKELIDPFNVETLMAVDRKKSAAVFENGELKLLVMPYSIESVLQYDFPQLAKIFKPLTEEPA